MEALHDVVKAGEARYLGASSTYAWQFAKMQHADAAAAVDVQLTEDEVAALEEPYVLQQPAGFCGTAGPNAVPRRSSRHRSEASRHPC